MRVTTSRRAPAMPEQFVLSRKQGNAAAPLRETPVFPAQSFYPCGFAGDFVPWATRETGFAVGGRVEHKNDQKFHPEYPCSPAPRIAEKSRGPENRGVSVSLVSFVRESKYPCGFAGGSNGKRLCCRLFPVLPVYGSSPAKNTCGSEQRVQLLGCNSPALATLGVTK